MIIEIALNLAAVSVIAGTAYALHKSADVEDPHRKGCNANKAGKWRRRVVWSVRQLAFASAAMLIAPFVLILAGGNLRQLSDRSGKKLFK